MRGRRTAAGQTGPRVGSNAPHRPSVQRRHLDDGVGAEIHLRRAGIGVREYVGRIEQAVIDTLAEWNILAARRDGAPGVYVNGAKIAALGIRVRRGCTFHGLAFNVDMDLEPFHRINPCGFQGLQVTQVLDLGGPSRLADVENRLVAELARQFGLEAASADPILTSGAGAASASGANVTA